MLLKTGDSRVIGRGNGGGNTYVGGDRGGNRSFQMQGRGNANQPAQSQVSHNRAQASSQPGRVYALTRDTHASTALEGNLVVFNTGARVLFDTGASHSFIASKFVACLGLSTIDRVMPLEVGTPVGTCISLHHTCTLTISVDRERSLEDSFTVLGMNDFDIILGMDWLAKYQAIVDCYNRRVVLTLPWGNKVTLTGNRHHALPVAYATRREQHDFVGWLCSIVGSE
jgi:hypothetical protein